LPEERFRMVVGWPASRKVPARVRPIAPSPITVTVTTEVEEELFSGAMRTMLIAVTPADRNRLHVGHPPRGKQGAQKKL
jgi:hypothetical protein